jgi:hypothetical protein
MKAPT